ncbi:MAG: hypothetical protein ACK55Z_12775, partial [bacterium]
EFDASDQTRQSARRAEGVGCRGDGEIDRAANADPGGGRTDEDGEVAEVRDSLCRSFRHTFSRSLEAFSICS